MHLTISPYFYGGLGHITPKDRGNVTPELPANFHHVFQGAHLLINLKDWMSSWLGCVACQGKNQTQTYRFVGLGSVKGGLDSKYKIPDRIISGLSKPNYLVLVVYLVATLANENNLALLVQEPIGRCSINVISNTVVPNLFFRRPQSCDCNPTSIGAYVLL